ncbi:MAG: hypothetical protein RBR34_13350 [Rhodospirillaceae bacterium]|nr:hypothetical protein [Rhodospirillaceae bacterium]
MEIASSGFWGGLQAYAAGIPARGRGVALADGLGALCGPDGNGTSSRSRGSAGRGLMPVGDESGRFWA